MSAQIFKEREITADVLRNLVSRNEEIRCLFQYADYDPCDGFVMAVSPSGEYIHIGSNRSIDMARATCYGWKFIGALNRVEVLSITPES